MTKNYYLHFSFIFLAHVLTLVGTWQLSQSDYVRNNLSTSITPGIIKLQIASRVIMNQPKVAVVKPKSKPKNPNLPAVKKEEIKEIKEEIVQEDTQLGAAKGGASKETADILAMYKAELRAKIDQNKFYPPLSRRLGQTGTVVIAFTLEENGNIVNVKIESPSQYERLNSSALDAVKKVERFKPLPREFGKASMDVKIPVKFVTI